MATSRESGRQADSEKVRTSRECYVVGIESSMSPEKIPQESMLSPRVTPEEENAVIRKLDLHLMPVFFVIYMLSVLDRSNLGNASVAGLNEGIGLQDNQYEFLGTVFYIGYIISQWMAAGWKQFPAHKWCSLVVLTWCTLSTLQASVSSFSGLAALRFLLGISEAMYSGLPLYLTFFYPRDRVGFRQGIFLSGAALANAYGGALGYAILLIKSNVSSWRILFLIEGLPTLIMVVIAWFIVPDDIPRATFLNERERQVAVEFVKRDQTADAEHHTGLRMKEVKEAFTDWRSYIPGIIYFACNVSFASLSLFVPTIVSEIGTFTSLQANGLSAPPYLLTFMLILIVNFTSDRLRMRGPFVSFFGFVSAVGFILLATTTTAVPRYLGLYLAITIFVCVSLLLPWVSNIHDSESKRTGGWAIFATLGQCGPLLGANLFPESEAPYYRKGSLVSMAFSLLVCVMAALFSFLLHRENKRLDKIFEEERREEEGRVSRPKGFRYTI